MHAFQHAINQISLTHAIRAYMQHARIEVVEKLDKNGQAARDRVHALRRNVQNRVQERTPSFEKIAHEPVHVFVRHVPLGGIVKHPCVHSGKCTDTSADAEQATYPVLGHAVGIGVKKVSHRTPDGCEFLFRRKNILNVRL